MKKSLVILLFVLTSATYANTISTFRFDEVDAVFVDGKIHSVEDLRDNFENVNGVQVNDESISISNKSKASIIFRNPSKKMFHPSIMAAKVGGDMGGG